ncbi:aminotransferase class I/II-fold pyridoxal phosphate-dependent enzyme [Enterococcus faecalis]|uniref:pyridoxal phosphate-dependent aminotransferase n=1 Tax=Enterococcus faecalis TaxID=1351 RepID=UPI00114376A9|nr:pyridoxal phosphate-dependent aminotransferase [Enterococcus faecalis]EIA6622534.1 pyridoxal phosphate-dependent aminotransferase [Enterococcus faecalis]EIA6788019.1 pyridoxal phosphate-dependent aminotransferase [Enterococcus faecalis]MBP4077198.1 pyridoxal phosphate-dependent aminotransferase [Enterococcus faecalis]MBP4094585.1 pyridoxal phosphate-dependent aminotransferase [Enterococcus faecalis]MUN82759.1 aminotransferase class I/II-fold pyridoxal phosphate-dependent enzyme [Enterococcu
MNVSNRAQQLTPSVTLAAAAKAKALKAKGVDVLSLTVGEPDFVTPKNIQKAAIASIEDGRASYYTHSGGIPELKQAIVSYVEREYQLRYQPKQVIVTDGAKYALYLLFQAILNVGDEVIIPVPYWVSYGEQVKLAEGKPVFVSSTQEQSFKVSVAQLEAVRTDKTKAIILNSPSNPTGVIYTEEELRQIGEWAVAHNILIIADDIYGRLVYNGHRFTPIATISEAIRQQTIIINGVSKTYAMTGWRIGFAVGDEKIIQAMTQLASQSTSNPVAVSQYAAIEALTGEQSTVEDMRQAFEKRLNHIYPKVAALPGVSLIKPEGAFYLFPNVKKTLEICGYDNVTNWVEDLLQEAHVALVTGEGFGAPEHVRMSYATDLMTLEKAIERMNDFIEKKRIQHNA